MPIQRALDGVGHPSVLPDLCLSALDMAVHDEHVFRCLRHWPAEHSAADRAFQRVLEQEPAAAWTPEKVTLDFISCLLRQVVWEMPAAI